MALPALLLSTSVLPVPPFHLQPCAPRPELAPLRRSDAATQRDSASTHHVNGELSLPRPRVRAAAASRAGAMGRACRRRRARYARRIATTCSWWIIRRP